MCSSGLQFIGNNCIHGEQFGFHLLHYRPSNRLRNLAKGLLQILTQVNSLNCKLRSVSGELKSAVYVYRRANDYCDYSSRLHENKPSSSGPDSAGLFKVAASVEKKIFNFHTASWVNAQLQGERLIPLLPVTSSRAQCEMQSSHKGLLSVFLASGWFVLATEHYSQHYTSLCQKKIFKVCLLDLI